MGESPDPKSENVLGHQFLLEKAFTAQLSPVVYHHCIQDVDELSLQLMLDSWRLLGRYQVVNDNSLKLVFQP